VWRLRSAGRCSPRQGDVVLRKRWRLRVLVGDDLRCAMSMSAYVVTRLADDRHVVEAWAGYPLQFEGQRRFGWQDAMAAELKTALAAITVSPGQSLAGTYTTTDPAQCDTENRLFTNPGASTFPSAAMSSVTSTC
jgi:hypothetical protein